MALSRRLLIAGAAGGFAILQRSGRALAQPAPLTVRVGTLPSEQTYTLVYAQRAGLFDRAGLKLEVSKGSSGAATAAAVAGGALDIGFTSILALVLGHARAVPFTIIAPSALVQPDSEVGMFVLTTSPLRTAKDFNGKTIAAAAVNDLNTLAMKAWMDRNGGDSSSFKVVEIPQLAQFAALEAGRIDAAVLGNPGFTMAMATGKAHMVANIYSAIAPRYLITMWFTTTGWVARNRTAAERFARIMADAASYGSTHAAETVDDVVAVTGLDRGLVLRMKRLVQTPTVVAGDLQPVIDAAARYKMIDASYPAAELISDAALR
jgi:NitT/TauT family transport system substrate-binding protein